MQSREKMAIVTGASQGIGRDIAERLAQDGFGVVVHYMTQAEAAAEVVNEVRAAGGKAMAIRANISNHAEVEALFQETLRAMGRIDVVVHSAGVMSLSPIAAADMDLFDRIVATNLRGTFSVLSQAAKYVAEEGRIIALSSSVIAKSLPGYGAYIAAKSGVEGLVRVLANELRGQRITVNAVAPGPVATQLFLHEKTPEQIAQAAKSPPLERLGTPEDISGVVSFLAGKDGGWVNAQVVRANGGFA